MVSQTACQSRFVGPSHLKHWWCRSEKCRGASGQPMLSPSTRHQLLCHLAVDEWTHLVTQRPFLESDCRTCEMFRCPPSSPSPPFPPHPPPHPTPPGHQSRPPCRRVPPSNPRPCNKRHGIAPLRGLLPGECRLLPARPSHCQCTRRVLSSHTFKAPQKYSHVPQASQSCQSMIVSRH